MLEIIKEIKVEGGCPRCGDSIQQLESVVNDHGNNYKIYPIWCPDCKSIVAIAKPIIDNRTSIIGKYIIEELFKESYFTD